MPEDIDIQKAAYRLTEFLRNDDGSAERNGNLEPSLYELARHIGPMVCADVVPVPTLDGIRDEPNVLLMKRDNNTVAPDMWWMAGGRVDKGCDYAATARAKLKKEFGLDLVVGPQHLIGMGTTIFAPNAAEKNLRDYTVATTNFCYARKFDLTDEVKTKITPADGHTKWKLFNRMDETHHPYVLAAVAAAWDKHFGSRWFHSFTSEAIEIVEKVTSGQEFMRVQTQVM